MNKDQAVQEAGGSLNDKIHKVERYFSQWKKQNSMEDVWCHVVDVFESHVVIVYGSWDNPKRKHYQIGYTMTDEDITFSPPSDWVEVQLDYVVVGNESTDEAADGEFTESATIELTEASKGVADAVILVEGESANGRIYTESALKSGVKVFSGAKMYADHPSRTEESERPERSVRDLVGKLGEAYVGKDHNGKTALRAPIHLSETAGWLKTLIKEGVADGLSIRAYGSGKKDSENRMVVESFIESPHSSVDFVTVPAAGGYAVLSESARDGFWDGITADEIQKHRPDLLGEANDGDSVEMLMEGSDMDLQQLQESHQTLLEENLRLKGQIRSGEAATVIAEVTKGLPPIVMARVIDLSKPIVEAYAGSDASADDLKNDLSKLVEAEKAYVAKLIPNGTVTGNDQVVTESDGDVEARLEEAFTSITGDESAGKIAAKGRRGK